MVDRAGRLVSIDRRLGATSLASFAYGRDDAGSLTSVAPGGPAGGPAGAWGYDGLGRLAQADGVAAFAHDPADNLTRLRGATQAFDAGGGIVSSTPDGGAATAFAHDGRGNRSSATLPGGSTTRWAGTRPTAGLLRHVGDLRLRRRRAAGLQDRLRRRPGIRLGRLGRPAAASADGTATFVHADQLGSVRVLTDAGGAVVGSASWDLYGAPVATSGLSLPFGLAGEYRDAESGFVYLRARYYDPATGTFLSIDPAVATTRSAYGYVAGDPLNRAGKIRSARP